MFPGLCCGRCCGSMGCRGQHCEPFGPCTLGARAVFTFFVLGQAHSMWVSDFTKGALVSPPVPGIHGQDLKVQPRSGGCLARPAGRRLRSSKAAGTLLFLLVLLLCLLPLLAIIAKLFGNIQLIFAH